jgi:hypothetical protein
MPLLPLLPPICPPWSLRLAVPVATFNMGSVVTMATVLAVVVAGLVSAVVGAASAFTMGCCCGGWSSRGCGSSLCGGEPVACCGRSFHCGWLSGCCGRCGWSGRGCGRRLHCGGGLAGGCGCGRSLQRASGGSAGCCGRGLVGSIVVVGLLVAVVVEGRPAPSVCTVAVMRLAAVVVAGRPAGLTCQLAAAAGCRPVEAAECRPAAAAAVAGRLAQPVELLCKPAVAAGLLLQCCTPAALAGRLVRTVWLLWAEVLL